MRWYIAISALCLMALTSCATTGGGMSGQAECTPILEKGVLKELDGQAVRDGYVLFLHLTDGRKISRQDKAREEYYQGYKDPDPNEVNIAYCVVGFTENYYILSGHQFEGGFYELINRDTGDSYNVTSEPMYSPDREHFLNVVTSDYAGNTPTIEIWEQSPRMVVLKQSYDPQEWEPCKQEALKRRACHAKWLDNKTVSVSDSQGNPLLRIIKTDGSWKVSGQ